VNVVPAFGCGENCAELEDMAFDLSMPILVVDDYSTMIRIIRNLLKQIGFENVDDASDGSAALTKMKGKKYGLVISDWNMEPMTGYDLLREVRASPALSQTPFIMITAESKTENVIAAKKAGVSNYIVKPFNAATLKTKMEAVFPGSIAATWDLPHLSGVYVLGIPVEDLVWYVYTAALWGTYYKFATGVHVLAASRKASIAIA